MVVGLPLEMVHGSLRIAAVYMAGVLAGKSNRYALQIAKFYLRRVNAISRFNLGAYLPK